ncbi:MAG: GNAT family N-acetyltransferase [Acetatifactor sp.]|nr:GNAT family N-acetyltransferase [Acetatifactor sp.]
MDTPVLITERLILRKFEESDLEAVYKIYSDTEVNKFLPWFPLKTIEETKVFYEAHLVSRYNQKCAYYYAVCLKKDNYPIGYVNVGADDSYDFGYGICKEFWHKGIAAEAGKAVVEQFCCAFCGNRYIMPGCRYPLMYGYICLFEKC